MSPAFQISALLGLIVLFGSIVVIAVTVGRRRDAQRLKAMAKVATELGLPCTPLDNSILAAFGGYAFHQNASFPQATSVMRTSADGVPLLLFDYASMTGTDKNKSWVQHTVAAFDVSATPLPYFSVEGGRDGFIRLLDKTLGSNGIAFPDDEDFARAFSVTSNDELAVRRVLGSNARAFLMQHANWSIRSTSRWLLITWLKGRPEPSEMSEFIATTSQGMRLLARGQA